MTIIVEPRAHINDLNRNILGSEGGKWRSWPRWKTYTQTTHSYLFPVHKVDLKQNPHNVLLPQIDAIIISFVGVNRRRWKIGNYEGINALVSKSLCENRYSMAAIIYLR